MEVGGAVFGGHGRKKRLTRGMDGRLKRCSKSCRVAPWIDNARVRSALKRISARGRGREDMGPGAVGQPSLPRRSLENTRHSFHDRDPTPH